MNIENFKGRRAISEQADDYPYVVLQQGNHFRIIRCRDGIQWIIQTRSKTLASTRWRPKAYCRSKRALVRRMAAFVAEIDPINQAILDALPDWIEGGGENVSCR